MGSVFQISLRFALIVGGVMLSGCSLFNSDDEDGPDTIDPAAGPNQGPECATEHLTIGVNSHSYDRASFLARYSQDLTPCRGYTLTDVSVHSLVGLPDGSEAVGVDSAVIRISGDEEVWRHMDEAYGRTPYSLGFVGIGGRPVVAVGWANTYGSVGEFELLDANTGDEIETIDAPYDTMAMGPSLSTNGDRVGVLERYSGIRDYVVDLNEATIGGTGTMEAPAPHAGGTSSFDSNGTVFAAAAEYGILYWPINASPAMLGPVACRWPSYANAEVPTEGCSDYRAVAVASGESDRFFAVCQPRAADEFDSTILIELGYQGDCSVIAKAPLDYGLTSVGWAGR